MARPETLCPAGFAVMTTAVLLKVRHDLATPADQHPKPEHQRAFEVLPSGRTQHSNGPEPTGLPTAAMAPRPRTCPTDP